MTTTGKPVLEPRDLTQALHRLEIAVLTSANPSDTVALELRPAALPPTVGAESRHLARDEAKRARKAQIKRNGGKR